MSVRKSDDFVADIEQQFEWYVLNAGWDVADHYLAAVEATCQILGQHPSIDTHESKTKIHNQSVSTEEVQTQDSIHSGAGRQCVAQRRKSLKRLSQGFDLQEFYPWNELDAAAGGHLRPLGNGGRVVAKQDQHVPIHHRHRRAGVQCESDDRVAIRSMDFGGNDDESGAAVEAQTHSTTAISSVNFPV